MKENLQTLIETIAEMTPEELKKSDDEATLTASGYMYEVLLGNLQESARRSKEIY